MTERVEQGICITFCIKLEHSSTETIWMIQEAAAVGNWIQYSPNQNPSKLFYGYQQNDPTVYMARLKTQKSQHDTEEEQRWRDWPCLTSRLTRQVGIPNIPNHCCQKCLYPCGYFCSYLKRIASSHWPPGASTSCLYMNVPDCCP
ncbi:RAS like family 12 [Phyllostomus discolor]|uniref:RAS like family 12 n=1 Tax=Phyllostomus discolor TaxID=89673 RepID=A0A834BG58_9CHIR|nr:RAS like family 12 [Phyllostomus discolor]